MVRDVTIFVKAINAHSVPDNRMENHTMMLLGDAKKMTEEIGKATGH